MERRLQEVVALIGRGPQINPEDYGWELAERILDVESPHYVRPHDPWRMRSGQSYGPILLWLCDACRSTQYSTDSFPPLCMGGHYPDSLDL